VIESIRETRDYELTMWHWASRFDAKREEIVAQYGEELFRAFGLYLWAGCHAFRVNELQAYHIIAERREDPGPRPGMFRRGYHFLRSLV
jgi:cyclopropane-fatty-acyl-phospholipid synthase